MALASLPLSTHERRISRRFPLALQTLVFQRGRAVALGRVQNLGLFGAYLQMESPAMPKHTLLELGFSIPWIGSFRFLRLAAMVVRTERSGIGVLFDPADAAAREQVRALLRLQA